MSDDDSGAPAPAVMLTWWAAYEDGSLGAMRLPFGEDPILTRPGRLVEQAEYEQLLAAQDAAREERRAQESADAAAAALADFQALIAAGIPEGTARRMSGYQPAEES